MWFIVKIMSSEMWNSLWRCITIYKKEFKLNSISKLASHVKKMILIKFRDSIIYWVYDWEKNKIHISYNIEINEKSIKENKFISALNKKSDT